MKQYENLKAKYELEQSNNKRLQFDIIRKWYTKYISK